MDMIIVMLLGGCILLVVAVGVWWIRRSQQTPAAPTITHGTKTNEPADRTPPTTPPAVLSQGDLLKKLFTESRTNAMYDITIDSGAVAWNDAFYVIFGYAPSEPANDLEWWATHIHPEDAMDVNKALDKLLDPSIAEWTAKYRFRKADGSYAQVSDHAQVTRNEKGEAVRLFGTMTIQNAS